MHKMKTNGGGLNCFNYFYMEKKKNLKFPYVETSFPGETAS